MVRGRASSEVQGRLLREPPFAAGAPSGFGVVDDRYAGAIARRLRRNRRGRATENQRETKAPRSDRRHDVSSQVEGRLAMFRGLGPSVRRRELTAGERGCKKSRGSQ